MLEFIKGLFRKTPAQRPALPPNQRSALPPNQRYVDETDEGKLYIEVKKRCPDCHAEPPRYMRGPSGGLSTNIFCAICGAGFNVTPMIEIAERIGKDERYITMEE